MTYSHDLRTLSNIACFELVDGVWCVDYLGPGGDYRVRFAGPDADLRAYSYAESLYPYEVNT